MISAQDFKSFDFTHVMYQRGDKIGKALAMISLLPQSLVLMTLTALIVGSGLTQRVAARVCVVLVVCEFVNKVLKNTIQELRPLHPAIPYGDRDYGMPSSHAQYSAAYAVLFVHYAFWEANHLRRRAKEVFSIIATVLALLVCYSRVHTLYHTELQVVAGAFVGLIIGVLAVVVPMFDAAAALVVRLTNRALKCMCVL